MSRGGPKLCKGCGRPLYVLFSLKGSKYRCVLCGHPHGSLYSMGRVASRRGLEAMAKREGWTLRVGRGGRMVMAIEPIVIQASSALGNGRDWREAEREALEWMKANGFRDARLTERGADGGVDIRARGAIAQVKDWRSNVGAPAVRELYGIAQAERAKALFFAGQGYTAQAKAFADAQGVARYTLRPVAPCNDHAQQLVKAWQKQQRREQWEKRRAEREARNEARRGSSF